MWHIRRGPLGVINLCVLLCVTRIERDILESENHVPTRSLPQIPIDDMLEELRAIIHD